jgi:hypothetical protein
MNEWFGEITVFKKSDGPLTKRLALRDGKIVSDSSACRTVNEFADTALFAGRHPHAK